MTFLTSNKKNIEGGISWKKEISSLMQPPPTELQNWLLEQGSITQKARNLGGVMEVDIVTNEWQVPWSDEKQFLSKSDTSRVEESKADGRHWIREIYMRGNNEPWWFGRTVIPEETFQGKGEVLLTLNTKPLGEFLFSQPDLKRSDFEFTEFLPSQTVFQLICRRLSYCPEIIWARRSIFYFDNKQLLLTEFFFPTFISWLKERANVAK